MAKNNNMNKNTTKYKNYWQERAEKTYLEGEKDALSVAKALQTNYKRCIREIENKINIFYGRYANENGLTLEDAKKYLANDELKDFKEQIKDILAMGNKENFNDAQLNEFKRLYTRAKITRLEELEANIKYEVDKLTNINQEQIEKLLEDSYEEGYYKTVFNSQQFAGFSSSFSMLNNDAIQRAINTKYLGANYSSRIWQNENNLMTTLEQEIPRGLTLGYNPRKLAKLTSDKLGTNYNNTVRLIRTEYGKILNDSTMAGYKASGIDRYQVLSALDTRTCDDCGELDSKIFKVSEGDVGINLPPFHPNCRCTTVPYFEPDEFDDTSIVSSDKTTYSLPNDITYKQWKDNLVELQNNKAIYKNDLDIPGLNTNANLILDKEVASKKEINFIKKYLPKGSKDIGINLSLPGAMTYRVENDKILFNPFNDYWNSYTNKAKMLIHEICHMIDIRNGITENMNLTSDILKAKDYILDNKNYYDKLINTPNNRNNMALGDIFSALTKTEVYNEMGHNEDYWTINKQTGIPLTTNEYLYKAKAELFANINQLYISDDKEALNIVKNIPGMKSVTNEFISVIKKYI